MQDTALTEARIVLRVSVGMQVDRLQSSGVAAIAVTSLTPKEEVTGLYKQIETDKHLKLLYGEFSFIMLLLARGLPTVCVLMTADSMMSYGCYCSAPRIQQESSQGTQRANMMMEKSSSIPRGKHLAALLCKNLA